jgi:DNA-directed RNA polymerase subunit RPC12/RpoP
MKFVCPKCNQALTIPDNRVPEAGAWARCPKCQERFFLTPKPVDLASSPQRAAPPVRKRTAEAQSLIDRLRGRNGLGANTSLNGPDNGLVFVTVFPTPAPNYAAYAAGIAVVVGFFVAAMGGVFSYDGPPDAARAEAVFPAPPAAYDQEALRQDLAAMRRDLARRRNVTLRVDYRGRESRVYKYFLAELAPGQAQDIVGLRLWSSDTSGGFSVSAEGLDDRQSLPDLTIRWAGENALATMPGQSGQATLQIDLAEPLRPAAANETTETADEE